MEGLNIELTTCCPLHCPQCYCTLEGGKHIPLELAKSKLLEAKDHGVKLVHLSGGETLCYPNLFELVSFASSLGMSTNVALSGWHFNQSVFNQLVNAGVHGIFISLNGSTKEINSITRDGFDYAISAIKLMQTNNYKNSYINWVMHSNNCSDFANVIRLAEQYDVGHIVILSFKPDSAHQLLSFPTGEQIISIAEQIKKYSGKINIMVETCFSQLLAVVKDTPLFGNLNVGPTKGCRAAIYNYNINVDGYYSPCRHLDFFEEYKTLDDYLSFSSVVAKIKSVENEKKEPCIKCRYSNNCRPCLAVSAKMHNDIFIGHDSCSLWESIKK